MISLKELRVKLNSKDGYAPKSADEKRFRDKHKVEVTADRNKNGDEVFKGSKVSPVDRKGAHHGYDVDKDQDVYEDVEQATDSIASSSMAKIKSLANQTIRKMSKKEAGESLMKITPAQGDKVMEEFEDIDEAAQRSSLYLGTVHTADPEYDSKVSELKKKAVGGFRVRGRTPKDEFKHLYKVGGALHRLTSQDIKPKHAHKVDVYSRLPMRNEETELDEVLNPSMGAAAYIKDFVHSKDPKFAGKSKKQRMKQALAAYYSAKRGD